MATATANLLTSASSTAIFRAWGSAVSAALLAVGLAQGADTGQINWTTVTAPTSNTFAGYEIWKSNDGGSFTWYLRIDYGVNTNLSSYRMKFQVGTSTDGAGTLTGNVCSVFDFTFTSISANATYPAYFSSDGGRLSVLINALQSNHCIAFSIARTRDSTGAVTQEGVNVFGYNGVAGAGAIGHVFVPAVGFGSPLPNGSLFNRFLCACLSSNTGSYGGNLGVYPVLTPRGFADNWDINGLVYWVVDLAGQGTTIVVPAYGTNHTYVLSGNGQQLAAASTSTAQGVALRYD